MKAKNQSILFFDGDCGLCNRSVRFLIRKDRQKRLYFAPLQGIAAQAILPTQYRDALDTVVYRRVTGDGQSALYVRSDAALLSLIDTGSWWRLFAFPARLAPKALRDKVYNTVARNRSTHNACSLPTTEEHARILP